jgi:hypothetical protein
VTAPSLAAALASGVRPVAPAGPLKSYADEYGTIIGWTAAVIVLVVLLILWGWTARKRRQSGIAAPEAVPAALLEAEPAAASEGMYVATVLGQDRLDRVAAHDLGVRSDARLEVHTVGDHAGVAVFRPRVENVFVPAAVLRECGTTAGVAGKFVEPNGLVAFTWDLGGTEVTTAFRPRDPQDRRALLDALQTIIDRTATAGAAQEDAR